MPIVEQYWQGVARRLLAESDVFNRLIGHSGEMGKENELSLAAVVHKLLPTRLGVGSGIVIDSQDHRSAQTDIVIFDQLSQPTVLAQTSQVLYPIEVLRGVIEVKTNARISDISDVAAKVRKFRELKPTDGVDRPFAFFAYDCADAPASLVKEIAGMHQDERPEFGCIMVPGIFWETVAELRVGFVPIHVLDEAGRPVAGSWLASPNGHESYQIEDISYPTFAPAAYGRQYLVGDPGRALLLFARRLWNATGQYGGEVGGLQWLDEYLSETATDLMLSSQLP